MRGSAGAAERRSIVASFQPRQDADPHPRERQGRRRLPARRDSWSVADHPDERGAVALAGDGDPLRAAIAQTLGMPLDVMLRLEIAPAWLSIPRRSENGVTVDALNDRNRLRGVTAGTANP